uniref:Uncharacterized protein n=1 Tax=Rhizophagus irregularis (strain DAOM 181602 / DAOM 197198 / MUCL 43194) TaxID=747089 RepID=U9U578_RHIID
MSDKITFQNCYLNYAKISLSSSNDILQVKSLIHVLLTLRNIMISYRKNVVESFSKDKSNVKGQIYQNCKEYESQFKNMY